jgi:hypothetical protein
VALELEVLGQRRRLLVLLELLLGERGGDSLVLGGADDEQRRVLLVLEVRLRLRVQVEVGETRLDEDLAGLGKGVFLVSAFASSAESVFTKP